MSDCQREDSCNYIRSEVGEGSNFINNLFFSWITTWMNKYNKICITTDELPLLPRNDKIEIWSELLEKAVNEEELTKSKGKQFNIWKPLVRVFGLQIFLVFLLKISYDLLQTLVTLSLRSFISSIENNNKSKFFSNNTLVLIFILFSLMKIFVGIQFSYWCGRVGLRVQSALISMTYRRVVNWKALANTSSDISALGKSARKSVILRHAEARRIQDTEAVTSSNTFNLIIVDALAVDGFLLNSIECFVFPLRLIVGYFLLKDSLGKKTTIYGMAVLLCLLFISFICQIIASSYKSPFMKARDKRVDRCHEVLSEIRAFQTLGLQNIANDRIAKYRSLESKSNTVRITLSSVGTWVGYQMSSIAQLVIFLLAVKYGIKNSLETNVPFVIPASVGVTTVKVLFSLLGPCRNLSIYSFATIEAIISFNRFQSFIRSRPLRLIHSDPPTQLSTSQSLSLSLNESTLNINNQLIDSSADIFLEDYETSSLLSRTSNRDEFLSKVDKTKQVVLIKNAIYTWNKEVHQRNLCDYDKLNKFTNNNNNDHTFKLNLDFSLSLNETMVVIGFPGSGKTSVMNAILDEIVLEKGDTYIQPRENRNPIAYSSQIPWIPNGTIRNIILFGRNWNKRKYDIVIDCCQLTEDIKSWQDGDLRLVDEGGFSISGGQRARVCLARALYSLPDFLFEIKEGIHSFDDISGIYPPFILPNKNINMEKLRDHESILYMLDDIFISLDPNVGQVIFEKLFGSEGLLRKVAVMLTLDYANLMFLMKSLRNRDPKSTFSPKIMVLEDGCIVFLGSFSEYCQYSHNKKLTDETMQCSFSFERSLEFNQDSDFDIMDDGDFNLLEPITPTAKIETLKKIMDKEGRITGRVSYTTYLWYFKQIKWTWALFLFIVCFARTISDKGADYYLGLYTSIPIETNIQKSMQVGIQFARNYLILILIQIFISSILFIGEAYCGLNAANKIHDNLLKNILVAPSYFFDSNPIGRIITRFGADQLMIDNVPVMKIATLLVSTLNVIFQSIVILFASPYVIIIYPVITLTIYYSVAKNFTKTSGEMQRLCLVLYSPLCGVFSEALGGGPIIRAFRAQNHYMVQGHDIVDLVQRAKYIQLTCKEWSSLRTQLFTFPVTILASNIIQSLFTTYLYSNFKLDTNNNTLKTIGAGIVGIALYYSESIASNIGMVVSSYVNMEKEMISAERIHQYDKSLNEEFIFQSNICKIDDISTLGILSNKKGVVIENFEVRYRRTNSKPTDDFDNLYFPPSLSNISLETKSNEHIGIIGRTGSGKSTFLQAILGFVPITKGRVLLDGIPINLMTENIKNKLIGVLPQVPLILKGWTIRNLVDPENRYSINQIWNALDICGLTSMVKSLPGGKMLDAVIVPDTIDNYDNNSGLNDSFCPDDRTLSDLQIRYLSFARLLLDATNYRLILVDEPPPDINNDDENHYIPIHTLFRKYFPHCTVFIVAHHAKSLQSCNKVWVLAKGRILKEIYLNSNFDQQQLMEFCNKIDDEIEINSD